MATHETQTAGQEPLVRDISDTALWAAVFRGRENDRPDALFRDPYAARLAGERGARIAQEVKFGTRHTWSWIARTYVADQMIGDEIAEGTDMVVNLAAGLANKSAGAPARQVASSPDTSSQALRISSTPGYSSAATGLAPRAKSELQGLNHPAPSVLSTFPRLQTRWP